MADNPTTVEIREWSKLDFAEYGYPPGSPDTLDLVVERAIAEFTLVTGRTFASLPPEMEASARQAVQGIVESQAVRSGEDYIETLADFDLIQNFSVDEYSETRRSAEDALKARMLHPWPWLHALLRRLQTPDKVDEYNEMFGVLVPAFEITEVDWAERWGPYASEEF